MLVPSGLSTTSEPAIAVHNSSGFGGNCNRETT